MWIRNHSQYFGSNGERVIELFLVDAETLRTATQEEADLAKEQAVLYFGITTITMAVVNERGQPVEVVPREIEFPIPAASRKQAFEIFEQTATDFVNKMKEEMENARSNSKPSIWVPNREDVDTINSGKFNLVRE